MNFCAGRGRGCGGFSAVAYYFARQLQQDLEVAVGVIDTSWSGTAIELWTLPDGFASVEGLENFVKQVDDVSSYDFLHFQGFFRKWC